MTNLKIKGFRFNELTEEVQEKLYYKWLEFDPYSWGTDNEKTLEEFTNIFPVTVTNWEYGYHKHINFYMNCDDEIEELTGIRLLKYVHNNYYDYLYKGKFYSTKGEYINGQYSYKKRYSKVIKDNCCVLTGYCIDDDILKPIYDFLKKPNKYTTFKELIEECLNSWVNACHNDYEHSTSFEYFKEDQTEIDDNYYTENGDVISDYDIAI